MTRMLDTADFLLYSSMYDSLQECRIIHGDWIVRRALSAGVDPTVVYLPMSNDEEHGQSQQQTSDAFLRLFEQAAPQLRVKVPYWRFGISKEEIERMFHDFETCEVLILGGGTSALGLVRYKEIGATGFGDSGRFRRTLETRLARGRLTVGFSAGAEQLSSILTGVLEYEGRVEPGFALVQDITVAVHFEPRRASALRRAQQLNPGHQVMALPNETALAIRQRELKDGRVWQLFEVIVDPSACRSMPFVTHLDHQGGVHELADGARLERIIDPRALSQSLTLQQMERSELR